MRKHRIEPHTIRLCDMSSLAHGARHALTSRNTTSASGQPEDRSGGCRLAADFPQPDHGTSSSNGRGFRQRSCSAAHEGETADRAADRRNSDGRYKDVRRETRRTLPNPGSAKATYTGRTTGILDNDATVQPIVPPKRSEWTSGSRFRSGPNRLKHGHRKSRGRAPHEPSGKSQPGSAYRQIPPRRSGRR